MLRQFFVRLLIYQELLPTCFTQNAHYFHRQVVAGKLSFYPETAGTFQYILAVRAGKIAFGKTAVINGVQQVGFANANVP